jgi:hypothetical protein
VVRGVALAEQHVACLQALPAHVGLEPDAREVALGRGGSHATREADHLDRAVDVDGQQRSVQQHHHHRRMDRPVDEEAEIAAHRQEAERDHRLDEGADEHQRRGDDRRADREDPERRRQCRRQVRDREGEVFLH